VTPSGSANKGCPFGHALATNLYLVSVGVQATVFRDLVDGSHVGDVLGMAASGGQLSFGVLEDN
jgi:hypothetical protein